MPRKFRYITVPLDTPDLIEGVPGRQGRFIARVLKAEYANIIATTLEAGSDRLSKQCERRLARCVEAVAKLQATGHGFRFPTSIQDFTGKAWDVQVLPFMSPYFYYSRGDAERAKRRKESNA